MNWKVRYWILSAALLLSIVTSLGCGDESRSTFSLTLANTLFPTAQNKVVEGEGVTFEVILGNKIRKLFLVDYNSNPIITCIEGCGETR